MLTLPRCWRAPWREASPGLLLDNFRSIYEELWSIALYFLMENYWLKRLNDYLIKHRSVGRLLTILCCMSRTWSPSNLQRRRTGDEKSTRGRFSSLSGSRERLLLVSVHYMMLFVQSLMRPNGRNMLLFLIISFFVIICFSSFLRAPVATFTFVALRKATGHLLCRLVLKSDWSKYVESSHRNIEHVYMNTNKPLFIWFMELSDYCSGHVNSDTLYRNIYVNIKKPDVVTTRADVIKCT